MCTGVELAMLAASAAGTAVSVDSSNQANRDRKNAIAAGLEAEEQIQNKSNEATDKYVTETFDPTTRTANYEAGAAENEKALGDLLAKQSDLGAGDVTAATTGAVSDTFTRAKAGATASAAARARNQARLMSRSGATGGLFGNEALRGSDYASDMLGFGVNSRLNANATNARYGAAGMGGNAALLGGLLSGAGQAMGGYRAGSPGYSGTQAPAPVETRRV